VIAFFTALTISIKMTSSRSLRRSCRMNFSAIRPSHIPRSAESMK